MIHFDQFLDGLVQPPTRKKHISKILLCPHGLHLYTSGVSDGDPVSRVDKISLGGGQKEGTAMRFRSYMYCIWEMEFLEP